MTQLHDLLNALEDGRSTTRQDAVKKLREHLGNKRVQDEIDSQEKGSGWHHIYQQLYKSIKLETATVIKGKTKTPSVARLRTTVQLLRWIANMSFNKIGPKTYKSIIGHIRSLQDMSEAVYEVAAFEYISILQNMLSFRPHREHLDPENWTAITELMFAVLLGDDRRTPLLGDDTEEQEVEHIFSDMDTDDGNEDSDTGSHSRKRGRSGQPATRPPQKKQRFHTPSTLSREQISCASVLLLLLQPPTAILVHRDYPHIGRAILQKFHRFLETHPSITSVHHDLLKALVAVLLELEINSIHDVAVFGRRSWPYLINIWQNKDKMLKESIVIIFTILLPFVGEKTLISESMSVEDARKLRSILDAEAEVQARSDALPLELLRLRKLQADEDGGPFSYSSFELDHSRTKASLVSWAILELYADCLSLSVLMNDSEGTSRKPQHPTLALTFAAQSGSLPAHLRVSSLQTLLFFIERHPALIDSQVCQKAVNDLVAVGSNDSRVQCWTLLCLAGLVQLAERYAETLDWQNAWRLAMRGISNQLTSRESCHLAYMLLVNPQTRLAKPGVLSDLGSILKEISIQGPSYPYDSVSFFLSAAMKVISEDVHLYRSGMEEKVVSWLGERWTEEARTSNSEAKVDVRPEDILRLLFVGRSLPSFRHIYFFQPDSSDMVSLVLSERNRNKAIRSFLLHASLPPFQPSLPKPIDSHPLEKNHQRRDDGSRSSNLRRVGSMVVQRQLDTCLSTLDANDSGLASTVVDSIRSSIDAAVVAIFFTGILSMDGWRVNTSILESICKLVSLIFSRLCEAGSRWSIVENASMFVRLWPLLGPTTYTEDTVWRGLIEPSPASGIRQDLLKKVLSGVTEDPFLSERELIRASWQNPRISQTFLRFRDNLLRHLRAFVTNVSAVDDDDDFDQEKAADLGPETDDHHRRLVVSSLVKLLARVPYFATNQPSAAGELFGAMSKADAPAFLLFCSIYLDEIRSGYLEASPADIAEILESFGENLVKYWLSKCEAFQAHNVDILLLALNRWDNDNLPSHEDFCDRTMQLSRWFAANLSSGRIRDWHLRDKCARYLAHYLCQDPGERQWLEHLSERESANDTPLLPRKVLLLLPDDPDIRVRLTLSSIHARNVADEKEALTLTQYEDIRQNLPKHLDYFEPLLTRCVTFTEIMVVKPSIRRGPYWHLLELSLHLASVTPYIQVLLEGAAERLGISSISELFKLYDYQIIYSVIKTGRPLFDIPASLLGYASTKALAMATFDVITPILVIEWGKKEAGKELKTMCKEHLGRTENEVARDCFHDLVARRIVINVSHNKSASDDDIMVWVREQLDSGPPTDITGGNLETELQLRMDKIIVSLLRMIVDSDYGKRGNICEGIMAAIRSPSAVQCFQLMNKFRRRDDFDIHEPNPPSFSTEDVLRSIRILDSLGGKQPNDKKIAVLYHVIHCLYAEVARTPLVNEQIRQMQSLCIWVSVNHEQVSNSTLLGLMLRGATVLLGQSELAHQAQSIIGWVFGKYRGIEDYDPALKSAIWAISKAALLYKHSGCDGLSMEIFNWGEEEIRLFAAHELYSSDAREIATLWPRPLHLDDAMDDDSIAHQIATSFFELEQKHRTMYGTQCIRRLASVGWNPGHSPEFSNQAFWVVKSCVPEHLSDADACAFSELLWRMGGKIAAQTDLVVGSARQRHQRSVKDKKKSNNSSLKSNILTSLFDQLSEQSYLQADIAYQAIRRAFSLAPQGYELEELAREHRNEARLLSQGHPLVIQPSVVDRELTNLIELDPDVFHIWVCQASLVLASALSTKDRFYQCLLPVIKGNPTYAEDILPLLVHETLSRKLPGATGIVSQCLMGALRSGGSSQATVHCVLDIIMHLRHFPNPRDVTALGYNAWLDVDFIELTSSAISCGSFTTALMFLEVAAEMLGDEQVIADPRVEELLYEIYKHIDDPDSFYGLRGQSIQQSLVRKFQHEQLWDKAHRFLGAQFEVDALRNSSVPGLVESLYSRGFEHQASLVLEHSGATSSVDYNLGWRTETWDLPSPASEASKGWNVYAALRAVHTSRRVDDMARVVGSAISREIISLRPVPCENLTDIRRIVRNIMCLREVNHWIGKLGTSGLPSDLDAVVEFPLPRRFLDFETQDVLVSTKISLFHSLKGREVEVAAKDALQIQSIALEIQCLKEASKAARQAGELQRAVNSITRAQELDQMGKFDISKELAKVLWDLNEPSLAIQQLSQLTGTGSRRSQSQPIGDQKPLLLARLGEWTAEARVEKAADIRDNYFQKAVDTIGDGKRRRTVNRDHAKVYEKFALFAHRQYQAVIGSPELARLEVYMERKRHEIRQLEKMTNSGVPNLSKRLKDARVLLDEDSSQAASHYAARDKFLTLAIEMYSQTLCSTDGGDIESSIRLCSLWYANFGQDQYGEAINTAVGRIPSHKFLFLVPQLTARLSVVSGECSRSQKTLWALIHRISEDHPFHILFQLLALTRNQPHGSQSQTAGASGLRRTAALDMIKSLKASGKNSERIRDTERLSLACFQLASFPIRGKKEYKKKDHIFFPDRLDIRSIKDLHVPVLTKDLPVDISTRYENIVYIKRYSDTFQAAGGVNMPKITECVGSDGHRYKQLFKGEGDDDLRQDAVMEQVFELVNVLLDRDRETSRRHLRMRAYKVIPLAPTAGILEFVTNTIPLRDWLYDAHSRYRPKDMSPEDASKTFAGARKAGATKQTFVATFNEIKSQFKPVMRHFFTEKHKDSTPWFSSRTNYSRSVAVTSIVGHLLGLGDRHASNILLDLGTGEVVHIDLGIAFEQGKLLPIPETIPFRFTADMVDGFGINSYEGVFRRCAEHTLRVLRENEEIILTVLQVFKYDPLHTWTANPVKMRRAQGLPPATPNEGEHTAAAAPGTAATVGIDIGSDPADESAHRALTSVSRKLDKKLSIESTVNELIVAAVDETNLACLFVGWAPYL